MQQIDMKWGKETKEFRWDLINRNLIYSVTPTSNVKLYYYLQTPMTPPDWCRFYYHLILQSLLIGSVGCLLEQDVQFFFFFFEAISLWSPTNISQHRLGKQIKSKHWHLSEVHYSKIKRTPLWSVIMPPRPYTSEQSGISSLLAAICCICCHFCKSQHLF